ncbi:hypothetical protein GPECTOR_2g1152 [Gonium pectorale]|uniref:S-adenosyl-L-methionine-dependent methyltransferase n=1 Tax=Gonium pectorale TaxID=33097 RepID=A0A150H0T8_GONPE|nr:hypothetical protein GPECTOR_2g1152 [Gonium pectorale]|eukprot:KXZ55602.1 hypothetical protein GPECTOR_2g1152 [Gonium pectorale]
MVGFPAPALAPHPPTSHTASASARVAQVNADAALSNEQQQAASGRRPIPRLIMRTKFFDDVISCMTWRAEGPSAAAAAHSCHARLVAALRGAPHCLQVVLLGSGLDSRPWRLELPPGVRWFEVDRRDVLDAKTARLRALGAELAPRTAPRTLPQQKQQGAAHPLRAASWRGCAVDLAHRGWTRGLEAASVSAPGSILAASVIGPPNEPSADQPVAASGASAQPSAPAQPAPAADPAASQPNAGATVPQAANDSGGLSSSGEGRKGYKLWDEFKWKCSQQIPQFFGECGWQADALSWLEAAKSYGLPTADVGPSRVCFVTAELA